MSEKKKGKEIVVDAPSRKRREATLLQDTTGSEAVDLLKAFTKVGRSYSWFMVVVGALLSLFCVYGLLASVQFSFSSPLFIGFLGFLGAVNIFHGLILLAKE
jgi:hypothetical protein